MTRGHTSGTITPPEAEGPRGDISAEEALLVQQLAQLAATQERFYKVILDLQAENADLRAQSDRLAGEIAALRASTSWRITAPLRWLRRGRRPERTTE